jgi:Arc/MetJ family transcription regulator
MRTTIDIDDDVLTAAKELAAVEKRTAGQVISDLARRALTERSDQGTPERRNGFRLLPRTDKVITVEFIEKLLEEDF